MCLHSTRGYNQTTKTKSGLIHSISIGLLSKPWRQVRFDICDPQRRQSCKSFYRVQLVRISANEVRFATVGHSTKDTLADASYRHSQQARTLLAKSRFLMVLFKETQSHARCDCLFSRRIFSNKPSQDQRNSSLGCAPSLTCLKADIHNT